MTQRTGAPEAGRTREILREFATGWPVVAVGALGSGVGVIVTSYVLSLMMEPLTAAHGWSRSEVGVAMTFHSVFLFLCMPWFGRAYDRLGVRRVGPIAVGLYVISLLALTQIGGSVWTLWIAYAAMGILGAGTGYLAYSRPVAATFDQGRGLALALTMMGPTIAAVVLPLTLPGVIETYGWRGGYIAMAIAAAMAAPLMLLVVRERRGSAPAKTAKAPASPAAIEPGMTLGQALRRRQFWHLAGGVWLSALGLTGVQLHFIPMVTDLGGSATAAAQALTLLGIGVFAGRVACGLLIDRLFAPFVAAAFVVSPMLGFILFGVQGVGAAPLLALLIGVAFGAESDVLGYLTSRYFGLRSYSEIFGWLYSCFAIGAGASPLLLGAIYGVTGDYGAVRIVGAGLCLAGAALYATAGRYTSEADMRAASHPDAPKPARAG